MKKTIISAVCIFGLFAGTVSAQSNTVQSGDTLCKIAVHNGLNLEEIMQANSYIQNPEIIYSYLGKLIQLPDHFTVTPEAPGTPAPEPTLAPEPTPAPTLAPEPTLAPTPAPETTPAPTLAPEPTPAPTLAPEPTLAPTQAPETTTPKPTPAPTSAPVTENDFAGQVVQLVNKERSNHGLQPLVMDASLSAMALDKAADMKNNNYFDHNSPRYGSPFDMMAQYGIKYSYAGENIAYGQRNPEEVMTAWMNSPGHKANILNPNFDTIGVGHYNGYWAQEFTGKQ